MKQSKPKKAHIPRKSRQDRDNKLAEDHERFIKDCENNGINPTIMQHYGYIY